MEQTKKSLSQKVVQSSLKLFQFDDILVWNFRKVIETNDTRYIYKLEDYNKLPKKYPPSEKWEDIFWEYIETKGIDYKFKLRLDLKAKIEVLKSQEILEGKNNGVDIMFIELRLKDLQEDVKKHADIENDAVLSKFLGFMIDPRKVTLLQYIGFEKLLIEANKEHDKRQRHI